MSKTGKLLDASKVLLKCGIFGGAGYLTYHKGVWSEDIEETSSKYHRFKNSPHLDFLPTMPKFSWKCLQNQWSKCVVKSFDFLIAGTDKVSNLFKFTKE